MTDTLFRSATDAWLRCLRPVPRPRLRLVCFPHAGGNAAFFRSWASCLPEDVELHSVQYPGRMDRIGEPLLRRMDPLANRAAHAIAPLLRGAPVALVGHSLGASVAHEVALRLARFAPALVVSGRPAPQHLHEGSVHLADDATVWAEIGRLGGTDDEILDNPALRSLVVPVLRADYEVAETYAPAGQPTVLNGPVLALLGDDDPEVTEPEARGWSAHAGSTFALRVFPGDHFYLVGKEADVVGAILTTLEGWWSR